MSNYLPDGCTDDMYATSSAEDDIPEDDWHYANWEKDRAKWQARYNLSRKHPELYPEELDAMMAGWEPEATPKQWAEGEKAERPQRPPKTDDPDCPF